MLILRVSSNKDCTQLVMMNQQLEWMIYQLRNSFKVSLKRDFSIRTMFLDYVQCMSSPTGICLFDVTSTLIAGDIKSSS